MIPIELVKSLHEVPEEVIIDAAKWLEKKGEKDNTFKGLLRAAKAFKHADCKPIFLANEDATAYCVSSEETYNQRLQ